MYNVVKYIMHVNSRKLLKKIKDTYSLIILNIKNYIFKD